MSYGSLLEIGMPSEDGRYLVYVQCASRQIPEWCEAKLATFHKGRWDIGVPVHYFLGPLPTMKMPAPPLPPAPQDWDL